MIRLGAQGYNIYRYNDLLAPSLRTLDNRKRGEVPTNERTETAEVIQPDNSSLLHTLMLNFILIAKLQSKIISIIKTQ